MSKVKSNGMQKNWKVDCIMSLFNYNGSYNNVLVCNTYYINTVELYAACDEALDMYRKRKSKCDVGAWKIKRS